MAEFFPRNRRDNRKAQMEQDLILSCAGHFEFEHDPGFLPNGEEYKICITYDEDEIEEFVITILVDGVAYKTLIDEDLSKKDYALVIEEIIDDIDRSGHDY